MTKPLLTIVIPTYERKEIYRLLYSLAPQITDDVEVIISDDSESDMVARTADSFPFVTYGKRAFRLGAVVNVFHCLTKGQGDWVWVIGDDDWLLPNAVDEVLRTIRGTVALDRLVLYTKFAFPRIPAPVRGKTSSTREILRELHGDASLFIAATCITANVWRRSILDYRLGALKFDSSYPHVWAGIRAGRTRVMSEPLIGVGCDHPAHLPGAHKIWQEYLDALCDYAGADRIPLAHAAAWNFVSLGEAKIDEPELVA